MLKAMVWRGQRFVHEADEVEPNLRNVSAVRTLRSQAIILVDIVVYVKD